MRRESSSCTVTILSALVLKVPDASASMKLRPEATRPTSPLRLAPCRSVSESRAAFSCDFALSDLAMRSRLATPKA